MASAMRSMGLKDRLRADLTTSIKARDEVRSSTLRMVLTSITNAEVAGKESRELTDEDVLGVLTSESKKRREAAEAFADAGRDEQAAKERAEAAVIADYLPEQLTEEEIEALVTATIDELGVREDGLRAMGRVMGALTPKTKGRADGGVVAAVVRRRARRLSRSEPAGLRLSRRRGRVTVTVGAAGAPLARRCRAEVSRHGALRLVEG